MSSWDRRSFLGAVTAAAGGMLGSVTDTPGLGSPRVLAAPMGRIRLGAPLTVPGDDPEALPLACRAKGYRAAYCPRIPLDDGARLRATEAAFRKHDVVIAEVGRWVNLLDADPAARAKNLATVTEGLALAEEVGARCCVDIAGSFSPTSWYGPHPDNLSERFFDAVVENARKILDAVKPKRTTFCYEMMAWSLPDSPDECLRMAAAVDRPAFSIHLDPCNLVNSPKRYYGASDLLRECYRKLGPKIASVHGKDLTWDLAYAVQFREVRVGAGSIDYGVLLTEHLRHAPDAPLMLEHLPNEAEYDLSHEGVRAAAAKAGISVD